MSDKRAELQKAAEGFCGTFASNAPLQEIMSYFSDRHMVEAHEHGLPQLAPFLGRSFPGKDNVKHYFELLAETLTYRDMKFISYIVDTERDRVAVKGEASFTWKSTNQSWHETFSYQLAFDESGKVIVYEVWADSGAAYLASKGLLKSS